MITTHNDQHNMHTKFRSDIQGLRAVAVLAVLFTHTFPSIISGGYVGVDIFFVISGYLISKILMRECSQGNFSISGFYKRRVKRIFPALIFVVISVLIFSYLLLSPYAFREVGRNIFSTMLFVSNIDYWKSTNYFANAAELKPLLHTWSLSVEEQFYIFFPILIFYLYKIPNKKLFEYILWGLFLSSLIISELIIRIDVSAAYYFFPSRAFELIIGAIIAYRELFKETKKINSKYFIYLGYLLITLPIFLFDSDTRFPGINALIPTLGTAILIISGSIDYYQKENSFLTQKWMTYVGNISFSLYLWHWPILAFLRNFYTVDLNIFQSIGAIFLSFFMASLSYEYVEKPFIKTDKINFLSFGILSIILLSSISLTIYFKDGFPERFSGESIKIFKASKDFSPLREKCHYEGMHPPREYHEACVLGDSDAVPTIAIWGDSHAAELSYVLGEAARLKSKSILEITSSSCPPAEDYEAKGRRFCKRQNQITINGLIEDKRISTVVMVANYIKYENFADLEAGLVSSINKLLNKNKTVILVLQTPLMAFDPPAKLGLANEKNERLELIGLKKDEFENQTNITIPLTNELSNYKKLFFFSPKNQLCEKTICKVYDKSYGVLYFNDNHLSVAGAKFAFKPLIDQLINE